MRNYIIISKEQADKVRGRHGKYSALEPVEFPDGMFGIPERVINDPEYDDIKDTLKQYQKECKVQDIEDLDEEKGKAIEKGKYYLSKEYWVVKAKVTKSCKLQKRARLSASSDFIVKKEIAAFVDAEKGKIEPIIIEEPIKRKLNLFTRIKDLITKIINKVKALLR